MADLNSVEFKAHQRLTILPAIKMLSKSIYAVEMLFLFDKPNHRLHFHTGTTPCSYET
jgi:hypothetical protein